MIQEDPQAFGLTEPLVSWRVWRLTDYDELQSVYVGDIWPSQKPITSDQCGIHSWKNPLDAINYMLEQWCCDLLCGRYPYKEYCIGQIYSWGKIEEYESGYHSEAAYPKIVFIFNDEELSRNLKNNYGCEIKNVQLAVKSKMLDLRGASINYVNCSSIIKELKSNFSGRILEKLQ